MDNKVAFLFPGQGSQSVGMCRSLYEHSGVFRQTVEELQDHLYCDLWSLIASGPERELKRTQNCQLALFTVSIATWRALAFEKPHLQPAFCAGLSLGELSALCASGTLEWREALDLVRVRAQLMEQACQEQEGKMVAVVGLNLEQVQQLLGELQPGQIATVANCNAAQQIVVSGNPEGIERFCALAQKSRSCRLVQLEVAGAFHSPLMRSAAEAFRPYAECARLHSPAVQVCSNVTGQSVTDPDSFRQLLVEQLTAPVLWYPTIQHLCQSGVSIFIELGPGRVLQGLNRRNTTSAQTFSVETIEDIASLP